MASSQNNLMESKDIIQEFIREFIPVGRSFSVNLSSDLKRFIHVIRLVFKNKFGIELPTKTFFYIDLLKEIGFPYQFPNNDEEYWRSQKIDHDNLGTQLFQARVKCTQKVLRELKSAIYELPKNKIESKSRDNSILIQLELFKERIIL